MNAYFSFKKIDLCYDVKNIAWMFLRWKNEKMGISFSSFNVNCLYCIKSHLSKWVSENIWCKDGRASFGNRFIEIFHYIGEPKFVVAVAVVLMAYLAWKVKNYRGMLFVVLTFAVGNVLNQLLKNGCNVHDLKLRNSWHPLVFHRDIRWQVFFIYLHLLIF